MWIQFCPHWYSLTRKCGVKEIVEWAFAWNHNVETSLFVTYLFAVLRGEQLVIVNKKKVSSEKWYTFSRAFMVKSH